MDRGPAAKTMIRSCIAAERVTGRLGNLARRLSHSKASQTDLLVPVRSTETTGGWDNIRELHRTDQLASSGQSRDRQSVRAREWRTSTSDGTRRGPCGKR
jgi:hypothetical protein